MAGHAESAGFRCIFNNLDLDRYQSIRNKINPEQPFSFFRNRLFLREFVAKTCPI